MVLWWSLWELDADEQPHEVLQRLCTDGTEPILIFSVASTKRYQGYATVDAKAPVTDASESLTIVITLQRSLLMSDTRLHWQRSPG